MLERYSRNRIYVNEDEQELIENVRILFGGQGLERYLRMCVTIYRGLIEYNIRYRHS